MVVLQRGGSKGSSGQSMTGQDTQALHIGPYITDGDDGCGDSGDDDWDDVGDNDGDGDDGGDDKSNDSDDGDDAPIWKPPNLYDLLTRLTSVSPLHSRTIATVSGIFCHLLSFSKDFYVSYIFE